MHSFAIICFTADCFLEKTVPPPRYVLRWTKHVLTLIVRAGIKRSGAWAGRVRHGLYGAGCTCYVHRVRAFISTPTNTACVELRHGSLRGNSTGTCIINFDERHIISLFCIGVSWTGNAFTGNGRLNELSSVPYQPKILIYFLLLPLFELITD